jgi:hypothetical protein
MSLVWDTERPDRRQDKARTARLTDQFIALLPQLEDALREAHRIYCRLASTEWYRLLSNNPAPLKDIIGKEMDTPEERRILYKRMSRSLRRDPVVELLVPCRRKLSPPGNTLNKRNSDLKRMLSFKHDGHEVLTPADVQTVLDALLFTAVE